MFHEMYRVGEPGALFAEAFAVMVWIDLADGKSRPIPEFLRKQLIR